MLTRIEIENFRAFSRLNIEKLGRVNLIVGKNNVGKTTLLEALRIYGSLWPHQAVTSIFSSRREIYASEENRLKFRLHSLFHGRQSIDDLSARIQGFETEGQGFKFLARIRYDNGVADSHDLSAEIPLTSPLGPILDLESGGRTASLNAAGDVKQSITTSNIEMLKHVFIEPYRFAEEPVFLSGSGINDDTLGAWWDKLSLTKAETRVLEAMKLVTPLQGVSFISIAAGGFGRIAKVSTEELPEPVALSTLGDGVVRMFQIAVAMEYASLREKPDPNDVKLDFRNIFPLLLIDEIESGIHHSLHPKLWRFIFDRARKLNVQVFATTHSLDCLRGFSEAVAEDEEADALAIRLEKVPGEDETGAVIIDRHVLPVILRDSIEVR